MKRDIRFARRVAPLRMYKASPWNIWFISVLFRIFNGFRLLRHCAHCNIAALGTAQSAFDYGSYSRFIYKRFCFWIITLLFLFSLAFAWRIYELWFISQKWKQSSLLDVFIYWYKKSNNRSLSCNYYSRNLRRDFPLYNITPYQHH